MTSLSPEHFEAMYQAQPDPWGFATSAYERAKYAHTLAAIRAQRPRRALELGCSIGVFTAQLAARCHRLVACDAAPTAVTAARARTADQPHVRVEHAVLPHGLPDGSWDLVVASEVLYYLDTRDLDCLLVRLGDALLPGGTLVAVHWRHRTRTYPQQASEVHDALRALPTLEHVAADHRDDYLLDVFRRRP